MEAGERTEDGGVVDAGEQGGVGRQGSFRGAGIGSHLQHQRTIVEDRAPEDSAEESVSPNSRRRVSGRARSQR